MINIHHCVPILLYTLGIFMPASTFDFDTGNAGRQVIVPTAIPALAQDLSPGFSDPTLLFRVTVLTCLGWFDALAPYHPTAIGVYTKHSHRLT